MGQLNLSFTLPHTSFDEGDALSVALDVNVCAINVEINWVLDGKLS